MNKYFILTKTLFKNAFNPLHGEKNKLKMIFFTVFIILALLPLGISFGQMISNLYDILAKINQEGIVLGFGFSAISMVIFLFGIFYVFGVFYFTKDIENLLALPLKSSEILAAKFTVILLYEYLVELLLFLPLIITYGIKSGGGIIYYFYSFIIFITLPIIPLILASIIDMLVMRFTGFVKNKDKFKTYSGIIAIFLAISINSYMQKFSGTNLNQEQILKMFSENNNSLLALSSKLFPSIKFGVLSIINSANLTGLYNLVLFLIINFIFIIAFLIIGEKLYFKGVIGISETSTTRRKLSNTQLQKQIVKRSPILSYTLKELKTLFRTPVFFMSCVLPNFLWPVVFIIPLLFEPEAISKINKLSSFLQNESMFGIIISAIFAFSMFITSSNSIASTAVSREGQQIYVNKYLPVSYKDQIISKTLPGMIMGLAGTLVSLIVLIFMFNLSTSLAIISIVICILGVMFSTFIGILLDLNFPKLVWDNEQKAVKQNFNVLYNMLFIVGFAALTIFFTFKLQLNLIQSIVFIVVIYSCLILILYNILITKGIKLFKNIQI